MSFWAVLPVKPLTKGKSRLHGCMKTEEVYILNECLYKETFQKLKTCIEINHILVVSQDEKVLDYARQSGGVALKENQQSSLNDAVSQAIAFILGKETGMVLIVPADLPWMTEEDLTELIDLRHDGKFMVIVPDQRQCGTNAIILSHPNFLVPQFGRRSFQKHIQQAANQSIDLIVWLNKNIQRDLDTPQDLLFYNKIKINPIHILSE